MLRFKNLRAGNFRHRPGVDWITQGALGAIIGELMLGKRLGKWALAWGAFIGLLLDLDVLVFPLLDTAEELAWHRGPSHSLIVLAVETYGLALGLAWLWQRQKISKAAAGRLVFTIWSVHLLVDCFTVEGAAIFWPVFDKRVAFNHLYQVDFLFSAPLVVTVLSLACLRELPAKKTRGKKSEPPSKRLKLCGWGLGLSAGYALLSVGLKFVASAGFDADLARRGTSYTRRMEAPTPYNIFLWRAVVDHGSELWVGYRTVFEFRETPVRWTVYLKGSEALNGVTELPETKALARFTDGWWIARTNAKGAWIGDLRLPEIRTWGSKKTMVDSHLAFSWVINLAGKGDHLREIYPDEDDPAAYLQRMVARIFGNRETWEANPRLAGIAGSLPEFLPVEE